MPVRRLCCHRRTRENTRTQKREDSCSRPSSRTYLGGESEDYPSDARYADRNHKDWTPSAFVGDTTENRRSDELRERVRSSDETDEDIAHTEGTDVERKYRNYDSEADEVEEYDAYDDSDAATRTPREFLFGVRRRRRLS